MKAESLEKLENSEWITMCGLERVSEHDEQLIHIGRATKGASGCKIPPEMGSMAALVLKVT